MFTHKTFDIQIVRELDLDRLGWPERGEALTDSGLGGNRDYIDLRRSSWSEAKRVHEAESRFIERIEASYEPTSELDAIAEELYDDDVGIYRLDIGIASTVIALSAAGCVPCASCNGGAFGDHHYEVHPLVVFFARFETALLLLSLAEKSDVGLSPAFNGALMVFSDQIKRMRRFAEIVIENRALLRSSLKSRGAQMNSAANEAPIKLK
ncbi:MAG: hypothetical protein WB680_16880 [Candidatus Acidiferrales bacterium]